MGSGGALAGPTRNYVGRSSNRAQRIYVRLWRRAAAMAPVRELTRSLVKILVRCVVTVRGLIERVYAISALERPTATNRSTSSSRGVKPWMAVSETTLA